MDMLPNALKRHTSDNYDDGSNACLKLTSMPEPALTSWDHQESVTHIINTSVNKRIHTD